MDDPDCVDPPFVLSPLELQDADSYEKQFTDWPFFAYAVTADRDKLVRHLVCMIEEPDAIYDFVIEVFVFVRAQGSKKYDICLDELSSCADNAGKKLVFKDEHPNAEEMKNLVSKKKVLFVYENAGKSSTDKTLLWELARLYESMNFSVLLCFSDDKEFRDAQCQMY